MATNDIRFNQIGGGCGTGAGLYTAYAPDKNRIDVEGKNFIGDWAGVIPDGSWVYVYGTVGGDVNGIYMTSNDGQMRKQFDPPPKDKDPKDKDPAEPAE